MAKTKADNKLLESREFEASIKVREAEFEAVLAATRVEMLAGKLAAVREGARLELQLLKDKETFHGQRVRSYQEALAALEVKAPAAGVVIYQTDWNNQKRQVGSTVFVMDKVLSIPDLGTLMVRGQVAEVDAYKVRLGQAVNVTFDAIPERVFRGRVTQMADMFTQPPGDRAVKVLELTVALDTPDPAADAPGHGGTAGGGDRCLSRRAGRAAGGGAGGGRPVVRHSAGERPLRPPAGHGGPEQRHRGHH